MDFGSYVQMVGFPKYGHKLVLCQIFLLYSSLSKTGFTKRGLTHALLQHIQSKISPPLYGYIIRQSICACIVAYSSPVCFS